MAPKIRYEWDVTDLRDDHSRPLIATWSLWAGVDLRTIQLWLGHSDIESTMRYLKPSRSPEVRDKVNEIFG